MSLYHAIEVEQVGSVLRVWLNQPEIRNAFNPGVITELTQVFRSIVRGGTIRCVVLGGRGKVFCSGADLGWMAEMANFTLDQNYKDAFNLAEMLAAINTCPCPVIGRVQGGAFGGALGLLACCDFVVAADDCSFAFSEVRLGISPATIAPYVIAKIGASQARALMLSGQGFDPTMALHIGLVHLSVAEDGLDSLLDKTVDRFLLAGPIAATETKGLILEQAASVPIETMERTAKLTADLRVSAEGQEGLRSFLEKRQPSWQIL